MTLPPILTSKSVVEVLLDVNPRGPVSRPGVTSPGCCRINGGVRRPTRCLPHPNTVCATLSLHAQATCATRPPRAGSTSPHSHLFAERLELVARPNLAGGVTREEVSLEEGETGVTLWVQLPGAWLSGMTAGGQS